MGDFRILFQATLPEDQDGDAFEAFLRDRYLPAVHRGPTRVGQVTGLTLWRGVAGTHAPTSTFILVMRYAGMVDGRLRVDDDSVASELDAFGAPLERLGAFTESSSWSEGDPPG